MFPRPTFPERVTLNKALVCFLCRIPIAFDLLVLKREWKSFITWSAVALILLLVRSFLKSTLK